MAKASFINRLKRFGSDNKKKLLLAGLYGAIAAKPIKEGLEQVRALKELDKTFVGGKLKKSKRSKSSKKKSKSNCGGACHPRYRQCGSTLRRGRRISGGKLIIR